MGAIEFRVSGPSSQAVAAELAGVLRAKFDVDPQVQPGAAPPPVEPGTRLDPVHAAIVVLEVAVLGFHVYEAFIRHPAEEKRRRLIQNWSDVIGWAKSKHPTVVRVVLGGQAYPLHESDPERLHHLTEKAAKAVTIVPE